MRISRYAIVFRSRTAVPYVYNALSNRLFRITDRVFDVIGHKEIGRINETIPESVAGLFSDDLLFQGEEAEVRELTKRKAARDAACANEAHVDLSICPTLQCNFRCHYCFEADQHTTTKMSADTARNVVRFAESFPHARTISVSWYGGEPLIGFSVIQDITSSLQSSRLQFLGAGLITNGFLLTADKISHLNSMCITSIQVTVDGLQAIHDSRRPLKNGRPTFGRIIDNLDALFQSSYAGTCSIRVNIDQSNLSAFSELQDFIMSRYPGRNLAVYGGRVERLGGLGARCGSSCLEVTSSEWTTHLINQCSSRHGGAAERLYPVSNVANICTATMKNSYVVGPRGELYKCWEDVGKRDCEVGNVNDGHTPHRMEEMYAIAGDPHLDEHCKKCTTMPICGGGCANRRLRKIYMHDDRIDFCSLYKDHLVDFLSEVVQKQEEAILCGQLLGAAGVATQNDVSEIIVADNGHIIRKY